MKESDRAERNLRIVLARIREVPVKVLADQYGISERQVRRIMADWREGSLKDETEIAVQHVNLILEQTRQDIEALNVASANVDINTRMKAIGTQVEHAGRSIRILRDAGVSFEDVLSGGKKDPDLIVEVNHAFRSTMSDYGIEGEAIEAATEASVQVFERWGYPVSF